MKLHSYELEGRGKVTIALAVMSVCLVWALDAGLDAVDYDPQWWLSVPSFGGFYAALYWIFDNRLWRWPLWRKMGLLNVPDLNGKWAGTVESSYGNGSKHQVAISISQRWSKLLVSLATSSKASSRVMATGQVCGRVTTARYSRIIWRLILSGSGSRKARSRLARAASWCGAPGTREFTSTLVSMNMGG